jgi:hypothetical protein
MIPLNTPEAHALVYDPDTHRFHPKTLLSSIFNELMVDKWNISISYSSYYHSCAPAYCTYSQIEHAKSFGGIVMVLMALIGGLTISLRLIAQQIMSVVHYLFKSNRREQRTQGHTDRVKLCDRVKKGIRSLFNRLNSILINLNMFTRSAFHVSVDRITFERYGRWSTRLYAILLIASLTVIVLHTAVRPQILTHTYNSPPLSTYQNLLRTHSDTLRCPCSTISTRYDRFIKIQPVFHEVCYSRFASEEWHKNRTYNLISEGEGGVRI